MTEDDKLTDREKKDEQDKLLAYLKDKYPNRDVEITQFFRRISKKHKVSYIYIVREIYAKIDGFIKFNDDYYSISRPFADDIDTLKPCASLTQEGFEYLNILKDAKNKKWSFRLSLFSIITAAASLIYNVWDKEDTKNKNLKYKSELKQELLDSVQHKTNHILDSLTKKKP